MPVIVLPEFDGKIGPWASELIWPLTNKKLSLSNQYLMHMNASQK